MHQRRRSHLIYLLSRGLMEFGDKDMAEVYLNSGSSTLEEAARQCLRGFSFKPPDLAYPHKCHF